MSITITYNIKTYQTSSVIYRMKELILNNNKLLKVISNIYIMLDFGDENEKIINATNISIISKVIRKGVMAGWIDKEVSEEFLKILENITSKQLGFVLEQIVADIGPYEEMETSNYSMDVKIDGVEEVNKNKNFDVFFLILIILKIRSMEIK